MTLRPLLAPALLASALAGAGLLGAASCADPTHDAEVNALGPEAPGVSPGPTHRPGQPCLTCHGGDGPANASFVTAGTIYQNKYVAGTTAYAPLVAGVVHLVDSTGSTFNATTNEVGNFFVTSHDWNAVFPLGDYTPAVDGGVTDYIGVTSASETLGNGQAMTSHIGRGGVYASCSYCHFDPPGPTSAGHVYQVQPSP
jgi:hypothetical protein